VEKKIKAIIYLAIGKEKEMFPVFRSMTKCATSFHNPAEIYRAGTGQFQSSSEGHISHMGDLGQNAKLDCMTSHLEL
jgi:hypothetical protein